MAVFALLDDAFALHPCVKIFLRNTFQGGPLPGMN